MFTTESIVLLNNTTQGDECTNLHYRCGDVTDQTPFLMATTSFVDDCGKMDVSSRLTNEFAIISNTLYNESYRKLEKMQLMKPKANILDGWELHNIALIRTLKSSDVLFDEYLTSEGIIFRFAHGTLDEIETLDPLSHTLYRSCEDIIHFNVTI